MCLIVALGVLSCFLFFLAIRYRNIGNKIKVVEWDMNIVTVQDYSVELIIDLQGYLNWYEYDFKREGGDYDNNISPGMSLKKYIINAVEKQLT